MDHLCKFSIFNIKIEVECAEEEVMKTLRFVYRHYLEEDAWTQPDMRCKLSRDSKDTFPPFNQPPLAQRFIILNACCVAMPNGQTILVVAPPYHGKTSFAIDVVEARGRLITDDMAVIDVESLQIQPFKKAICLRSRILAERPEFLQRVKNSGIYSILLPQGEHGQALVVHPFDILQGSYCNSPMKVSDQVLYLRSERDISDLTDSVRAIELLPYVWNGGLQNITVLRRLVADIPNFHVIRSAGKEAIWSILTEKSTDES